MIMAGFSGSATADAVALGGVLIPVMNKQGYPPEFSAGITASAACIGPIIPPSLTMVIYGALTGLSVGKLFLAGLIPGICIGLILMLGVFYYAKKYNYPKGERTNLQQKIKAFREVFLALLAPVIVIGGLVSGVMTATETGVACSAYAFFLGYFVYKEIKINQILKILSTAAIHSAVPIIIMAGAAIFGWVLAYNNFASSLVNLLFILTSNAKTMLMLIILMLLIVGLFVEGGAATVIFVPLLFPIGKVLGCDPYQFAMIVEITMMIGTITPPVGLQLYICSNIAKVSISKTIIWPFAFLMLIIVILIVFFPFLATFLPSYVFS
jgi:C4-dicarboxylate transporter DctM subunit